MPTRAECKAAQIADAFLNAEFDSDAQARTWLIIKIAAALGEAQEAARQAGYKEAMSRRF